MPDESGRASEHAVETDDVLRRGRAVVSAGSQTDRSPPHLLQSSHRHQHNNSNSGDDDDQAADVVDGAGRAVNDAHRSPSPLSPAAAVASVDPASRPLADRHLLSVVSPGRNNTSNNGDDSNNAAPAVADVQRASSSQSPVDADAQQPAVAGRLAQLLPDWVCVRRRTSGGGGGSDKATQTRRDPLQTDAERLALDVVYYVLGRRSQPPTDQLTRTLRLATDEILSKHRLLLSGMVARLQITPETCYDTFVGVADELFDGGHVTWARIVTFYAFGARLALYCHEKDMAEFVPEIAHFLGVYATEHLTPFVRQQGGWAVMCEHFQYPESMEGKVWKALLKLGIGLGIAATATLITASSR